MAIKKTKTLPTGVEGEYWRITEIHLNVVHNYSTAVLGLYLSKIARDAGNTPIMERWVSFYGEENPLKVSNLRSKDPAKLLYEKLRSTEVLSDGGENFVDAEDVIDGNDGDN